MADRHTADPFHTRPLRIGILAQSFHVPRWVETIIADIVRAPFAELALFVVNTSPRKSTVQRIFNGRRFLYNVYTKLDELVFPVDDDAFREIDVQPLIGDCPVLHVQPMRKKFSDFFSEEDVAAICSCDLDVLLRFGFRILKGAVLHSARYGVWSYHHADNCVNRGGQPCFWEVMENQYVTGSVLQILSSKLDAGQVIYRSYGPTYRYSVKRNKNRVFWKTARFVNRKLKDLHESGPDALKDPLGDGDYRPYSHRLYKTATNWEMIRLFPKMLMKLATRGLEVLFTVESWSLGYHCNQAGEHPATTFYASRQLVPPKTVFWADPFVVQKDGRNFIFVEEYVYQTRRGRISVIEMDPQGHWQQPYPVLTRDYHLSYPFVFEWNGEHYMIPESADNRTVDLYKCTSFPDSWELQETLLKDVTAVDATLFEYGGRWWMFVVIGQHGLLADELFLYFADTPLGPWTPHRRNPVKSDVRSSRPAGKIFKWQDHFYRPAQDCSKEYGHAISINRLEQLDTDEYRETEVSRIVPAWRAGLRGTHTLNHVPGLTIVDQKHRRFRRWW